MASTVTASTLTVKITESIKLNGRQQGGTSSIGSIVSAVGGGRSVIIVTTFYDEVETDLF